MSSDTAMPRPFEMFYADEKHYIFAPVGCVLVNGIAADIPDADEYGNVELDLSGASDYLYAHVIRRSNSSSEGEEDESAGGDTEGSDDSGESASLYEVYFDAAATKANAIWDIRVLRFGQEDNDGNQYDILTSTINLGGDGSAAVDLAGCFAPSFYTDSQQVEKLVNCYYQCGGRTFSMPDVRMDSLDNDGTPTGVLALKVAATTPPPSGVPAVALYADLAAVQAAQNDISIMVCPLYVMNGGIIVADLRRMPTFAMWEDLT